MKSTKGYVLFALLLFGTLLLMSNIDSRLSYLAERDYRVWKWMTIRQLLYIPVGFALALPYFVQNFNKKGVWKVDYKKMVIWGIPALFLTFYLTIHFHTPVGLIMPSWFIEPVAILNKIGGLILGYVVFTSFYKYENNSV